mgnify:CR=1 FL=1
MRIVDLLSKDSILLNASPKNKAEAIDLLVDLQVKGGKITDRETYKQHQQVQEERQSFRSSTFSRKKASASSSSGWVSR